MISQQIAFAVGSALVTTVICFPMTYLAMHKQFKLRGKIGSWKPFLSSLFALATMELFGLSPDTNSIAGTMMFLVVPITVCGLILYFTYRTPPEAKP